MSDDATGPDTAATPDASTRIEVVGGGTATPEQLAALVVALTPVAAADGDGDRRAPAWARAGLLENVGGMRVASPADLAAPGDRL